MELVTPDIGLISWTVLSFAVVVLHITALISIFRRKFTTPAEARFWILIVLFLPLIGSVLYFRMIRQSPKTARAVHRY